MSFIADTKSQLAKLMATENISVEHRKIKTAGFDPKSRVLYLPIWQNMNGTMYDLLCGHEVGHALYTPAEGWHNVVVDETKGKGYKSFLNVVEDARIEKKVKRRYPGLNSSFKAAYNELFNRDFFGVRGRDLNQLPFIDRMNIYTKSQYTANVQFTAQEEVYIRRAQELETWEDVVNLTDEIYEYAKKEMSETWREMDLENNFDLSDDGDDDYDDYDDGYQSSDDGEEEGDDGENAKKSKQKKEVSDEDEEGDDEFESVNREKDSGESIVDQYSPYCETDNNYRRNETLLVDEKCKDIKYVEIPKPNLDNIITPAKRVHETLTKELAEIERDGCFTKADLTKWVNEFKNKNERYVGLLAKEFEMRKAAKAFSKSKLSDTGDIDVSKLASYKFDDNIFRKVMLTPKGKSHGLILLLDKSGSMSNNMAGSIEQILILSMFCRKVNIPFIVYGFGDSYNAYKIDRNLQSPPPGTTIDTDNAFEKKPGYLNLSPVRLREYLHSKMTNAEFTTAIRHLIYLKKSYESREKNSYYDRLPRPESEDLSNTPLTQALVALVPVMKKFKSTNNLDITNLVIVHDGDADRTNCLYVEEEVMDRNTSSETYGQMVTRLRSAGINGYESVYVLRDRENHFEAKLFNQKMSNDDTVHENIVMWFKKITGSKIFSFYLLPTNSAMKSAVHYRYHVKGNKRLCDLRYDYNPEMNYGDLYKELMKKFRAEKFLDCNSHIIDGFYLVAGGNDLKTEDEEIEVDGKVTAAKLKTAFMKFSKKRVVNRVLVSKFISGIAA